MSVEEAKRYMEEGQFEEGTRSPKIEAAIDFIGDSAIRKVFITKLDETHSGMNTTNGTLIHK